MSRQPWTLSIDETLDQYNTSQSGLSTIEAQARLTQYGPNALPEEEPTPLWEMVLEQFKDTLVLILLASAMVSLVLAFFEEHDSLWTAFVEPAVILLILIGNAVVGVLQESQAEQAINALQHFSPQFARVTRDGEKRNIQASELVPGDVISVAVGDKVPADARIISITSNSFKMDQAVLTGESESVGKELLTVRDPGAVKQDMVNMLFSGTTVSNGLATAIVTATGSKTALGDIHTSISTQIAVKTPLKRKLDEFGNQLAQVISIICILVWLINVRHFSDPAHGGWLKGAIYYLKIAVALAVAAIPEGLAAVITACLALGTQKMAKRGAIVRNLPSVETLGCTNVICSDKTGTLTTNQMSVCHADVLQGQELHRLHVSGTTFAPVGEVTPEDQSTLTHPALQALKKIAALCNTSSITFDAETETYGRVGEPTEAALRVFVEKLSPKSSKDPMEHNNTLIASHRILSTFEFSRDRKSMSVLVDGAKKQLLVKGAPDSILARSSSTIAADGSVQPLTDTARANIHDAILRNGAMGVRTLAFAYVDDSSQLAASNEAKTSKAYEALEQNMIFVGLVAMLDPPRPEVKDAVIKCRLAGIRVIVITGDDRATAEAICRSIGIFGQHENLKGKSFTGKEWENLSQHDRVIAAQKASLFSRVEPLHKSELVDVLQSLGLVVAMTGDGVNDAPALKKADIGVAMGSGTDVAKLAADMVLVDDNFASIERAVEEGRAIYNNTKQFIRYLISSNIGEVVSIFLTVLLGMPEALIPVQLLWLNLVTDGLPATALGFNPPDSSLMRTPPRKNSERLIGGWLFFRYMVIGVYVGCATVAAYAIFFMYSPSGPGITWHQLTHFHKCASSFPEIGCAMFSNEYAKKATTMSLSTLVTIEMFNALNSLSENESLLTLPPWSNPYVVGAIILSMALHFLILYVPFLAQLFVITPLSAAEWLTVLYLSAPVILIDEILKYLTVTFVQIPARIKHE